MALTEHHKSYMDSALPVLKREEHLLLFKDYRAALASGDAERASRLEGELVQRNMGLANKIALKWWRVLGCSAELDDVIASTIAGLLTGIRRFNPNAGFAPSSFLIWHCTAGAQRFAREGLIHVPPYLLETAEGRELRWALNSNHVRLDDRFRSESGELKRPISETVADVGVDPADEAVLAHVAVQRLLGRLDPVQRQVVAMRHGLPPYDRDHTLTEIGEALGVTREWARQLERRAMETMSR